jgi:hypothetical protein
MAHFAQVNEDNVVVDIMKLSDDYEDHGEDFINNVCMIPGRWIKTSYNTYANKHRYGGVPFRGNYATIGGTYDPVRDVFLPKKEYPSMVLNEQTLQWEYAVPYPPNVILLPEKILTDVPGRILVKHSDYFWNEDIVNWELKHFEKIIDVPLD